MTEMKRIVVTGGNKGIGKALCSQILCTRPDTFVYLGARDSTRGAAAVADIVSELGDQFKSKIAFLPIDVTDVDSVKAAAATVRDACGGSCPLYGVVNNAGIATGTAKDILDVNAYGVKRVSEAFIPLLQTGGRVVTVSSGSGPSFVSKVSEAEQPFWDTHTSATWTQLDKLVQEKAASGDVGMEVYGFSKAVVNVYTILQAKEHPTLLVNSLTPGMIQTDILTDLVGSYVPFLPRALTSGLTSLGSTLIGAKPVAESTKSALHCLFGDAAAVGSGCYFGSDGVRSPLTFMRSPGTPVYKP
jgi:carbonyl reductase 1